MTKALTVLAAAGMMLCACPVSAQETYGPPDVTAIAANPPPERAKPDVRWKKWEIAFQVANAADFATTEICLRRGTCREGNPILGRNPSTETLLAVKAGTGLAHYLLVRRIARTNPEAARIVAIISTVVVGGVATANLRFVF